MRHTINSRKTGETFSFWAPDNGGYVRLESAGRPGSLGQQICHSGRLSGNTITCQGTHESLRERATSWYRAHMREQSRLGI